ncbi:CAP domain-containing protein [candidate division WWE3 bacterium]|nr:CAP domain-containing protein [candidate division WWE3 bacterium]
MDRFPIRWTGIVLLVFVWSCFVGKILAAQPGYDFQEQQMLVLINEYRAKAGISRVDFDPILQSRAETWSRNSPLPSQHSGNIPEVLAFMNGSDGIEGAYNSLYCVKSDLNLTPNPNNTSGWCWDNSPNHKAIILSTNHKYIGIAHEYRSNFTGFSAGWYWVIQFSSTPQIEPPALTPTPIPAPRLELTGDVTMSAYTVTGGQSVSFSVPVKNNAFIDKKPNHVILRTELNQTGEDRRISQKMTDYGIELVVPIQIDHAIGVYMLGRKTNKDAYTVEDLAFLDKIVYYASLNIARKK